MWVLCVFFFSSRRRHTRSLCDWSSDVCSSDLVGFSFAAIASVPAMSAIGGAFGWRWAFATMGVLLLLLAFAVLRWFPDARPRRATASVPATYRALLRVRGLWSLMSANLRSEEHTS